MPSVVRKLVISAAVDGLILQPHDQRTQRAVPNLLVRYTTYGSATLGADSDCDLAHLPSLEAYGIAIEQTEKEVRVDSSEPTLDTGVGYDSSASEGSYHSDDYVTDDYAKGSTSLNPPYDTAWQKSQEGNESVAQDVISRRGQYGRFAEKWFSRNGWTTERRKAQGMSVDKVAKQKDSQIEEQSNSGEVENSYQEPPTYTQPNQASMAAPEEFALKEDVSSTLLPKLLRTTKLLFASRSFFFSYDYDITRRVGHQKNQSADLPLHRVVEPIFFWNHHLARPFVENGDHAYVLPVMQGFIGQRTFSINQSLSKESATTISIAEGQSQDIFQAQDKPEAGFTRLLTLISRRSVLRAGLRYLRRGVDEDGHTANSVETEQILSGASWSPSEKIYSFTQYRGSIPLFFSQSPYAFKPVPILQRSFSTNHASFKRHFSNLISRYGDVQVASLVDKHGREAEIGRRFEEHTERLIGEDGISGIKPGFEWFDFHAVCRGTGFENISILMDTLGDTLDRFGTTVELEGQLSSIQKGVLRTNCMDCLDRTNVVQSACGSKALENQLKEEGMHVTDTTTQWFNTLWADNGDAISKQYSSTAALKGDFTRTRKRDYRGALNDLGLTLSRFYNNIVNDFFSQAAIDYLLGNVTEQVFEEFEANMMSKDPSVSMRTVRANAIDTSFKIVIADQSEDLIGGWTLLTPQEPNTVRTFPFQEVVLLLTDAALYAVRFDWIAEKVSSFERVVLTSITGIFRGTYITSTLTATQMDEDRNIGFVIKYRPGKGGSSRFTGRSFSTAVRQDAPDPDCARTNAVADLFDPAGPGLSLPRLSRRKSSSSQDLKLLAFKALPARSSLASAKDHDGSIIVSEKHMISNLCDNIRKATYGGQNGSDTGLSEGFVEEKEIVNLKEAKKSTGYLEQWGHELKKLVWA
ncbi:MAG: hypothetical protein Q9207_002123 [Kuettlingeria erythrocarpa]